MQRKAKEETSKEEWMEYFRTQLEARTERSQGRKLEDREEERDKDEREHDEMRKWKTKTAVRRMEKR